MVTSYSIEEAESDEDAMRELAEGWAAADAGGASTGAAVMQWRWEAEVNPYRSLARRGLQFDNGAYADAQQSFMSDNNSWQCLVPSEAHEAS